MKESIPRPVVVGVDGSTQSLNALAVAGDEAALRHVPLRIVHARSWPTYAGVPAIDYVSLPSANELPDSASVLSHALASARAGHPGLPVSGEVVDGGSAYVLIEESSRASLVVLGSRGIGGFTGLLVGSTAVQVATHAQSPVLVVRGDIGRRAPVVVGIEGGAAADAALAFGFGEAARRGVALHAICARNEEPVDREGLADGSTISDRAHQAPLRWLRDWRGKFPDVDVRSNAVDSDDPVQVLTDASRQASLVVIGSHMRGELRSRLLGSVGYALIHCSRCPLAFVHSGEFEGENNE